MHGHELEMKQRCHCFALQKILQYFWICLLLWREHIINTRRHNNHFFNLIIFVIKTQKGQKNEEQDRKEIIFAGKMQTINTFLKVGQLQFKLHRQSTKSLFIIKYVAFNIFNGKCQKRTIKVVLNINYTIAISVTLPNFAYFFVNLQELHVINIIELCHFENLVKCLLYIDLETNIFEGTKVCNVFFKDLYPCHFGLD